MNNINNKQSIDSSWQSDSIEDKNKNDIQITQIKPAVKPKSDKKEQVVDIYQPQKTSEEIEKPAESQLERQKSKFPPKTPIIIVILKTIGVFIGIFVFVYLFLTFPAQYEKVKYWLKHLGKEGETQEIEIPAIIETSDADLFLSTIKTALETEKPIMPEQKKPEESEYSIDISDLENNHLIIPKIEIKVPIIWNSSPDENVMMKNLQKGVVHYNGTGLPNETNGNTFISGHSSYYWWDKGNYKTVFVNLNKLENGDELALAYEDKVYIYQVYEKFEVKPEQVEVVESQGKPIVTLMTCVPVGTNLRRLIVRAKRIEISIDEKKEEPISTPSPEIKKPDHNKFNPLDIINLLPWRW